MSVHLDAYHTLVQEAQRHAAQVVVVSKTQDAEKLNILYDAGVRDFGENYVQELCQKKDLLPADILWHFIGHLQRNKVKYIAPFVHFIHSVDSLRLLDEIEKSASQCHRHIQVLLQIHIAREETKFGMSLDELDHLMQTLAQRTYQHITLRGLMTMASFTEDNDVVRDEFRLARTTFLRYQHIRLPFVQWDTLSMGMTHDYRIALEEGSTMIRIGSLIFGKRV